METQGSWRSPSPVHAHNLPGRVAVNDSNVIRGIVVYGPVAQCLDVPGIVNRLVHDTAWDVPDRSGFG